MILRGKWIPALCFLSSLALKAQTEDFYIKVKDYNLEQVINPDSISDDSEEKFLRPELLGYIGDDYQRF